MPYNPLTPEEKAVIEQKGTERPGSGEYDEFFVPGTYICRRCNAPLYRSDTKFDAHCGWPAFDQEIPGSVDHHSDPRSLFTGSESELTCHHCGAHLGHNFVGEHFTPTNNRHCVNSIALRFIPTNEPLPEVKHEN